MWTIQTIVALIWLRRKQSQPGVGGWQVGAAVEMEMVPGQETFQQRAQLSWKKGKCWSLSVTSTIAMLTPPVLKQEGILERE